MKLDLKTVLPYLVLIATLSMTWGMWSERIQAVEVKADRVAEMQQDIAVIKAQITVLQEDIKEIKELLRD
jgi:lipopolysaccharide export system protein LptA